MSHPKILPFISRLSASGSIEALLADKLHPLLGNENRVLQFKNVPELLVAPEARQRAFDLLGLDVADEVFRHRPVENFQLLYAHSHDACPSARDAAHSYQNTSDGNRTQDSLNRSNFRFRAACDQFESNAASSRGKPLTALVQASGASRYLKFLKNQSAKKYSAINPTAAAPSPMIHHMRTAFGFVLQSNRSARRGYHGTSHSVLRVLRARSVRLVHNLRCATAYSLIASPKAFSAILLILHSPPRANAGHRGCVSGQL